MEERRRWQTAARGANSKWGCPKMGVPRVIIQFHGILSNKNHPAIPLGYPHDFWETPHFLGVSIKKSEWEIIGIDREEKSMGLSIVPWGFPARQLWDFGRWGVPARHFGVPQKKRYIVLSFMENAHLKLG